MPGLEGEEFSKYFQIYRRGIKAQCTLDISQPSITLYALVAGDLQFIADRIKEIKKTDVESEISTKADAILLH